MSIQKRVLLTGATGFVGSNLARRLCRDGHDVHLLVRPGYAPWRIQEIIQHVTIHEVDLKNLDRLSLLGKEIKPQWIFHLAAYGAYSSQNDMDRMVETNIVGTAHLLEVFLKTGFEVFINTGSSSEYGFKDHAPSEDECLNPNSLYAVTKASGVQMCSFFARQKNVKIPTLRLYSVYGPYEEPSRFIPTLILSALEGQWPPLADAGVSHDFIYIDDVVDAFISVAGHPLQDPGAIFNVGSGTQISLKDVVSCIGGMLPVSDSPKWGSMPNRSWDTHVWVASIERIKKELGWFPRFTLEAGLSKTVDWFKGKHGQMANYQSFVRNTNLK